MCPLLWVHYSSVMIANNIEEMEECLSDSGWGEEINADYQKRGAKKGGRK